MTSAFVGALAGVVVRPGLLPLGLSGPRRRRGVPRASLLFTPASAGRDSPSAARTVRSRIYAYNTSRIKEVIASRPVQPLYDAGTTSSPKNTALQRNQVAMQGQNRPASQ
jgi:hypothetical protein